MESIMTHGVFVLLGAGFILIGGVCLVLNCLSDEDK